MGVYIDAWQTSAPKIRSFYPLRQRSNSLPKWILALSKLGAQTARNLYATRFLRSCHGKTFTSRARSRRLQVALIPPKSAPPASWVQTKFASATRLLSNNARNGFKLFGDCQFFLLAHSGGSFGSDFFKPNVHPQKTASPMPVMIWLLIIAGAALLFYFLIGWLRASHKHDQEKEAHRRFGGTAPKK